MNRKATQLAIFSILAVLSLSVASAEQSAPPPPWVKECRLFKSPRDYVSKATMFCLRSANQRACHKEAAAQFASCKFTGNYERMSQAMHAKMLLVLALAGTMPGEQTGRT